MFFTRVGTAIAWLGLVLGVLRIALGLFAGSNLDTPGFNPVRYLGSATPGQAIDQGTIVIVVAVALGVLAEIGRSIHRNSRVPQEADSK